MIHKVLIIETFKGMSTVDAVKEFPTLKKARKYMRAFNRQEELTQAGPEWTFLAQLDEEEEIDGAA